MLLFLDIGYFKEEKNGFAFALYQDSQPKDRLLGTLVVCTDVMKERKSTSDIFGNYQKRLLSFLFFFVQCITSEDIKNNFCCEKLATVAING